MDRKTLSIGVLFITAVALFLACIADKPAKADFAVKDRDYQLVTMRSQGGDDSLYVVDNRSGKMVVFAYGYNPAVKADIPQVNLPHDNRFLITSEEKVFPPNLATLQQVRDARSYDVLRPAERINPGIRWIVGYRGIVELPNAIPQPMPRNAPPPGVGIGLAISLAALAIEFFLHDRHASG